MKTMSVWWIAVALGFALVIADDLKGGETMRPDLCDTQTEVSWRAHRRPGRGGGGQGVQAARLAAAGNGEGGMVRAPRAGHAREPGQARRESAR